MITPSALSDSPKNPDDFKLYAPFADWDETVDFVVDGIAVQAIAKIAWRRKTIRLTMPFAVEGSAFNVVDEPPLFALSVSRLIRRKHMAERGETERDDTLRMGMALYKSYRAYLQVSPAIDAAQARIKQRFQPQLDALTDALAVVTARTAPAKRHCKEQHARGEITQTHYQTQLQGLRAEVKIFSDPLDSLRFDRDFAMREAQRTLIAKQLLLNP